MGKKSHTYIPMILGIIGGIIGLANQSYEDINWVTLIGSILGLISALMIKTDPKRFGGIMRSASFLMFISFFSWFFEFNFDLVNLIVGILFFLGGFIAIGSYIDEEQNISTEENNPTNS